MSDYEQVYAGLRHIPRLERAMIFRDGLERAAKDVPELERLRRETCPDEVGRLGARSLAFALCLWGEREGVLDQVFPVSAVKEDGGDETT